MFFFVLYSVKNILTYFDMHQRYRVPVIYLISFFFYFNCPADLDSYEQQEQDRQKFQKQINKISPYDQHQEKIQENQRC